MEEINGYHLSRKWFDFCFENPEKINPNHTAIFFFAIEHCNRLGWKNKFGFPTQMTMDAIGIKKHQTYIKYFNDICEWGFFILVQKSTNQYSANIISLSDGMPKNGKALDKAFITHAAKQTEPMGQSTGQSNSSINKQITINNKPINNKEEGENESCDSHHPLKNEEPFPDSLNDKKEKEKSSAEKEKDSAIENSEASALEASASLTVNENQQVINTEEEERFSKSEKRNKIFEGVVLGVFERSAISHYSDEYKNLWIALCKAPKWKKKTTYAYELSIKQLSKYDETFGMDLMEKAISGNYQGVVFDNTPEKYQEYLRKKSLTVAYNGTTKTISAGQSAIERKNARDQMGEQAERVLDALAAKYGNGYTQ